MAKGRRDFEPTADERARFSSALREYAWTKFGRVIWGIVGLAGAAVVGVLLYAVERL